MQYSTRKFHKWLCIPADIFTMAHSGNDHRERVYEL
jgi:hypothetical protein